MKTKFEEAKSIEEYAAIVKKLNPKQVHISTIVKWFKPSLCVFEFKKKNTVFRFSTQHKNEAQEATGTIKKLTGINEHIRLETSADCFEDQLGTSSLAFAMGNDVQTVFSIEKYGKSIRLNKVQLLDTPPHRTRIPIPEIKNTNFETFVRKIIKKEQRGTAKRIIVVFNKGFVKGCDGGLLVTGVSKR